MPSAPPSFRLLSTGLRALLWAQDGHLGPYRASLRETVALRLHADEVESESAIDAYRATLRRSTDEIAMQDFGAGTRAGLLRAEAKPTERRIAEIYERAAATPSWGRFLFRLVRALKPWRVLELGTNLGVSAAHITLALHHNAQEDPSRDGHLVTLEGDPTLANRSRTMLDALGQDGRSTVVTGRFSDTLPDVLETHGPFDLVFLDGHHEEAATLRYFDAIRPHLTPGACVAFDDIEPGRPVRNAWRRILRTQPPSGYVDLLGLGLWFEPSSTSELEEMTNDRAVAQ